MSLSVNSKPSLFARAGDLLLAAGVVVLIATMIIQVPPWFMDCLIATNIGISVALLLAALYVPDATRFPSFPTILLLTTLFRLALNVSTTRLILLEANAGEIIYSFGNIIVQGNFVVGGVVFLVLVLVQFIVITKGSERVAEVSARFVLDMMPGKQMSIDADMRGGLIDADEARRRRQEVEREAKLYGAMDGAMKFVKGDAIAGICISIVNIIGGLIIGVTQMGMTAGEAAQTFSLLTIGDGLVSQIPSLLIGVAAGLVVTRVANKMDVEAGSSNLASDIFTQALGQPKAMFVSMVLLLALAFSHNYTSLPRAPFLLLAGIVGLALLTRLATGDLSQPVAQTSTDEPQRPPQPAAILLRVHDALGSALGLSDVAKSRAFAADLESLRAQLSDAVGLAVPPIEYRFVSNVASRGVDVVVHGQPTDHLNIESNETMEVLAKVAGSLRRNAAELLGIQETSQLLEQMKSTHAELVRSLTPMPLSTQQVMDVLKELLSEQISIAPLRAILESLASSAQYTKDPGQLTDMVRQDLKRAVCDQLASSPRVVDYFLLHPGIEQTLRGAVRVHEGRRYLELGIDERKSIVEAFRRTFATKPTARPVVITGGDLRRTVRGIVQHELPETSVLAWEEAASGFEFNNVGQIKLAAS